LICVPIYVSIDAWRFNEELMNELNIEIPTGMWTWDDFYNLAYDVCKDLNGDVMPDVYMIEASKRFPLFWEQYLSNSLDMINDAVNIEEDILLHMLDLWKKIVDSNFVLITAIPSSRLKENVLFAESSFSIFEGSKKYVFPPTINDKYSYLAELGYLCINRFSSNKETAAELLEVYLRPEIRTKTIIPLKAASFYKDLSLYNIRKELSSVYPLSNDINYEIYAKILRNSKKRMYQTDIDIYFGDIMEDYLDNKITKVEAVKLITKKLEMKRNYGY